MLQRIVCFMVQERGQGEDSVRVAWVFSGPTNSKRWGPGEVGTDNHSATHNGLSWPWRRGSHKEQGKSQTAIGVKTYNDVTSGNTQIERFAADENSAMVYKVPL